MSLSEARWYWPDGRACPDIDGKAPTIREARKHGLLPSVTTYLSIIRKEGLEQWMLNSNKLEAEAARVEASERGREFHAAVAEFLGGTGDIIHNDLFDGWAAWFRLQNLAPNHVERSAASPAHHYAGTADLIALDTELEEIVVIDWKTQRTSARVNFYPEWALQLAAYANLHGYLGRCRLMSVVVSVTQPGRVEAKTWPADMHQRYFRDFLRARDLWLSSVGPGHGLFEEDE